MRLRTMGALVAFVAVAGCSSDEAPGPVGPVGTWGTAALVETDDLGIAYSPQVAMDPSGNAIAVWHRTEGTRHDIWANRYTAGSGWGTAAPIPTQDLGPAYSPQVAMDPSGNAIAVWHQSDGTRENIWANRYAAGSGWGTAALIETENLGEARSPQVAMDPSGNAIAVWYQWGGTRYDLWSNRYTAGSGWGTAALIETENLGNAGGHQVAMDLSGNAIAVWHQRNGIRDDIWANRYTAGSGWGVAALIETENGNASYPQVAMDHSGNAIAVWMQDLGTHWDIWANRYTSGSGWGTAALIETEAVLNDAFPQVAVDPSGNAIAVWQQSDGTRVNIWANRYTTGSGWGAAALIETDDLGDASGPQIAMDPSGNAIAVWQQSDGTRNNIWARRYAAASGWGTAALIETDDLGGAAGAQVAMDHGGFAIAVWYQSDGSRDNILANRFQ